jgi:hypothetical protein
MHSAKAVLKLAFFKGGNARIHGFRDRKGRYKGGARKRSQDRQPLFVRAVPVKQNQIG